MKTKIFFLFAALLIVSCAMAEIRVGASRTDQYLPLLNGKRVAMMSNHTGIVEDAEHPTRIHTLDLLLANGVQVTAIFSPEHGFRGTAREGEIVQSSVDEKTGVPILSMYDGKGGGLNSETMAKFDILIVDIQDVGLRFYTYYVTMVKLMNACAEYGKPVIVFDRPNPNGHYVDGPILDMKYKSGVGGLPIPTVHGMTLGELARMVNGEGWLNEGRTVDLVVIPCLNYTHQTVYRLPVAPSPNLRTMLAVYLYPSICLFEGTPVSLGRGTDHPFLCYGHPLYGFDGNNRTVDFTFTPNASVQKDRLCYGVDLRGLSEEEARNMHINLNYVIDAYRSLKIDNFFFSAFFEKLTGVDYVRKMIIAGKTNEEICAMWQDDVERFKQQRRPYLMYAE